MGQNWTLTTANFQSQEVELRGIDSNGISYQSPPQQIPFDHFLMLSRTDRPNSAAPAYVVNLQGGDRAAGQPRGIEGENLLWDSPSLGRLTLSLRSVLSIARGTTSSGEVQIRGSGVPQNEDVVTLSNGDTVRGIVLAIDSSAVTIQSAGDKTMAPLDSLSRISFAAAPSATRTSGAQPAGFRIALRDYTAITAAHIELRPDNSLAFAIANDPATSRSVPMSAVISIEQVNGPVVWLSELTPVSAEQTSFFEMEWPARMDRTVDGLPIRFGNRTFAHGIGVHSLSKLVYAIDPAWQSFRTQYAISGDWPYADVDVRITVDGQLVHEAKSFRSGVLAPTGRPVIVDLSGHKQIILEVEYGQNYDVQDRFNWIEPAFLKYKPPADEK